jgi:amidase
MLRSRKIGCLELLDAYLNRVDRFNPAVNAVCVLDAERARKRARAADRALGHRETWGALHGVPMTVKESFDVAGLPTTWGRPELKGNVPSRDAIAVERLQRAGAIIFGKTNVPTLLADWQTFNPIYGTTNNPWDLARRSGTRPTTAACSGTSRRTASARRPDRRCRHSSRDPIFQ